MGYYDSYMESEEFLAHHGILGQKWGVRRYQNKDGSLTAAGKKKAALGAEGRAQILKEGEAKARNKRIQGSIAKGAAQIGGTVAGAAAGALVGSTAGPVGTVGGIGVGISAGAAAGKVTGKVVKALYNEKANAINNEYLLLANDIMKEYENTKVKDISDGADADKKAHEAVKKAGLDQGDNYKVYRDAQAGDKKSQEVVKQWEKEQKKINKLYKKSDDEEFKDLKPGAEITYGSYLTAKARKQELEAALKNKSNREDLQNYYNKDQVKALKKVVDVQEKEAYDSLSDKQKKVADKLSQDTGLLNTHKPMSFDEVYEDWYDEHDDPLPISDLERRKLNW